MVRQKDDWHLTADIKHELGSGDPFAAAVRASRMPMLVTDPALPDNPIVFCNEAFQNLSGYSRDEIIGRNCRFLQGKDSDPDAISRIRDAIREGHDFSVDILNYRKDGTPFWNALYLSPVRNSAGDVQFFFASQLDITERIEAHKRLSLEKERVELEVAKRTVELRTALDTKTLLLHEVDHRVKNNLTLVASMLRLQARAIGDPKITKQLEAMICRLDALSSVHRQLYESADVTRLDIGELTRSLVSEIVGASGRDDLKLRIDIDRIEVPSNLAIPIGLIVSEVATNAVKHGFAHGRSGNIDVTLRRKGFDGVITISDDGHGHGSDGTSGAEGGFGSVLIQRMSLQIGGKISRKVKFNGTSVVIVVPLNSDVTSSNSAQDPNR